MANEVVAIDEANEIAKFRKGKSVMANENETVEQVCEKMDNESGEYHIDDYGLSSYEIGLYKERILAAHKRDTESLKWKLENYANIVAAKDAEIARLKSTMVTKEAFDRVWVTSGNKTIEIRNLRSLISELADALEKIYNSLDYDVEYGSHGGFVITDDRFNQSELGELIEKAKKEVK